MLSVASRAIRTTEPNRPATVSDSIPSHHRGGRAIRPTGTNIPQTPGGCNRGQPGEHPPPEDWSIRQTRVGDHRPGARPSGRAGTSSCRTRSEHPPGQGNGRSTEPGAAACPTYRGNIRQTGASDHHLRANIPGDGPSAIRRKNIRQTGRTTAGPAREHPSQSVGYHRLGCRSAGLRAQSVPPVLGCRPPGRSSRGSAGAIHVWRNPGAEVW